MNELTHLKHAVGQNSFHLVWKPKWARNPMKFFGVRSVVTAALRQAAKRHHMKIYELEVMDDHVHCFIELKPSTSVSRALQLLKGYSARMVFKHHPWLRRHFRTGHFWSPGKFYRSVGTVTAETIKRYIAESNRSTRQQTCLTRYPGL